MPSASDVYASKPALPVLAHSLLSHRASQPGKQDPQSRPTEDAGSWDLKRDINNGLESSESGLFCCGKIIGFSKLRTRGADDSHAGIEQLPLRLLTTHLHKAPKQPSSTPNTFIIHPTNFDSFAPRRLLEALLSSTDDNPALPRDEAIQRLDNVQLFPVMDLRSAVHAINEVSNSLHKIQEERGLSSTEKLPTQQLMHPAVFIIVGLDTLAEGVIRTSNPVKAAAVLTAALRSLTQLSRMHASFLSVMLVNTNGVGALSPAAHASSGANPDQQEGVRNQGVTTLRNDSLQSVFHQPGISSLFPTLLMRTLDHGIDTHLLLSTVRDTSVLEVIKDRVGHGVGRWCVWSEES